MDESPVYQAKYLNGPLDQSQGKKKDLSGLFSLVPVSRILGQRLLCAMRGSETVTIGVSFLIGSYRMAIF